jgi:sn-glycerol 3-phosphate transport system permease protein
VDLRDRSVASGTSRDKCAGLPANLLLITSSVETRPLMVGLALLVQSSEIGAQWDLLSAGTLIVAVPILIALVQKQFTNSFLSSGIK